MLATTTRQAFGLARVGDVSSVQQRAVRLAHSATDPDPLTDNASKYIHQEDTYGAHNYHPLPGKFAFARNAIAFTVQTPTNA